MVASGHPDFVAAHAADGACGGCWEGFPRPCRCGARIHAERGDGNDQGDIWLNRWCTACGVNWDYPVVDRR